MAKVSLRLFPRGFLGKNLNPQIERTPKQFIHPTEIMNFKVDANKLNSSAIFANPHVEAVYSSYIKRSINSGDFDFRENVLRTALDAFGTNNFELWCCAQYDSPSASDRHNDFIVDTIRFIQTGRRDVSLETWMSLVHITDEGNNIGPIPTYIKEFFGISEPGIKRYPQNNKIIDVIQQWCSKPNGLEDLIGTLHILFGNA